MSIEQGQSECCPGASCTRPRREFLRSAVLLGTAAIASRYIPVMAGPFARADFEHLVPADKKLAAQWVASLFERGQATVYHGDELGMIGMPIGGITTGQLYLGGDGKLWHWDIFNQIKATGTERYTNPKYDAPLDQGFTLKLLSEGVAQSHQLAYGGFADISFRGEYPIGYVEYRDPACPIAVALAAFSPFIPLSVEDSSLPATLFRFTLTNTGSTSVAGELEGLIENAVARSLNGCHGAARTNRVEREGQLLFLDFGATLSSSEAYPDAGTMGLALFSAGERDEGVASVADRPAERPAGTLTRKFSLAPGASEMVTFAVVWRFPHLTVEGVHGGRGRNYATRFDSAAAVARYIDRNVERLYAETKLWHDTWYESSLPHWLLERTLLNVSTLATSTAFRFADGRFYGSEGVGCCPGTCTHVWHYEQAMGRLFPQLDVLLRERTDFNPQISFMPDGMIKHRGECHITGEFRSESDVPMGQAVDGQAGTILRALRDHQTSPDDAFLKRNWPAIKKATQWLISQDSNTDGILEGAQHNTLDAEWYGPVSWLSGLYLAALRAAEEMALDAGDRHFAASCRQIFETGQRNFVERLFNGEYFINRPDPKHAEAVNSGTGCEIDQVFGQSWAFQVGVGRVLPEKETRCALESLWRYNFTPDVGPYRAVNKPGEWFAMPGEAGLLMCTFPRSDWNFEQASGKGPQAGTAGYFNQCMTGFEHQVAGHMIWEGMVMEGLAIERAIHDRYRASLRNPWNEIECGDHYARSMASYGVYIAACGFEYHGPRGHLGFAPRLKPENFKGAFTAAQGWGIFAQTIESGTQRATVDLKWGTLRLRTLSLRSPEKVTPTRVTITVNGHHFPAHLNLLDDRVHINLARDIHIKAGEHIIVELS